MGSLGILPALDATHESRSTATLFPTSRGGKCKLRRGGDVAFHPITHALVGWVVAHLGRADRPTRVWCLLASLAPDLDGISLVFGLDAYGRYHHLLTHNLLFGVVVTLGSTCWVGRRLVPLALVFAAFLSHLVGDYFGSGGWGLWPYLPFSDRLYACDCAWKLVSWQNFLITLGAMGVAVRVAIHQGRTPLEFVHAGLEQAVVNTLQLRRVKFSCNWCLNRATVRCHGCTRPLCPGHVASRRRFDLLCQQCLNEVASG
ncbi:MAG: metal-dependent hydrolase [Rhodothermales bacterium]